MVFIENPKSNQINDLFILAFFLIYFQYDAKGNIVNG